MKIFICDGSLDGFYAAVFDAYNEKNCLITSKSDLQLSLDSEIVNLSADIKKSERVQKAVYRYDREALEDISLVLRSCDSFKEQKCFNYLKILLTQKKPVKKAFNLPEVVNFNDILYKVMGETHRLKGFLRFMECISGAFYAPYSPDNDITELLMPHFAERLKSEKFIIHDIKRKIAGIYNGSEWIMGYAEEAEIYLSEYEKSFESLWKKYYKSVNIVERPHEKQMKGYMPVRYWKFLPEKKDT